MYQQYDKAPQVVLDFLLEQGFSRTPRKCFCQASREFKKFMQEHHLEFSHGLTQTWLGSLKPDLLQWKFLSFRRSMALIDNAVRHGTVTSLQFFTTLESTNIGYQTAISHCLMNISRKESKKETNHRHCRWILLRAFGFFFS